MEKYYFDKISLLITHYNRTASLKNLLDTFNVIGCSFAEIIVSDDCSPADALLRLAELQKQYQFKLITTPVNKGLGNNINKGQDAVVFPYTLYIQEDFEPKPLFAEKLQLAYQLLEKRNDLDLIRFYAYTNYPHLNPYKDGFSEMTFSQWPLFNNYTKFYLYSDHPHLRRSNFLQKFGRYKENVNPEKAEYSMMMNFLAKKGKALFYNDYTNLLEQKNSSDEPSTMKRTNWRDDERFHIRLARHFFRHIKFNIKLVAAKIS